MRKNVDNSVEKKLEYEQDKFLLERSMYCDKKIINPRNTHLSSG